MIIVGCYCYKNSCSSDPKLEKIKEENRTHKTSGQKSNDNFIEWVSIHIFIRTYIWAYYFLLLFSSFTFYFLSFLSFYGFICCWRYVTLLLLLLLLSLLDEVWIWNVLLSLYMYLILWYKMSQNSFKCQSQSYFCLIIVLLLLVRCFSGVIWCMNFNRSRIFG